MIAGVTARVRVDDVAASIPFYEQLTGVAANRFAFSGAELAAVGPFLLFQAEGELGDRLARVVATVAVADLTARLAQLTELGATVVAPPVDTPNGRRAVVRHPDGSVFEYVGA